ncbi:lipase member H-B-like [Augochlora pura]
MTNYLVLAILVVSCSFVGKPIATATFASSMAETLTWTLFVENGDSKTVLYNQTEQLLEYLNLDVDTVIHCHGYMESTATPNVVSLLNSYIVGTNYNVIGINYNYVTHSDYITAASLADNVAAVLVNGINKMVTAGLDKTKLILSGFSLGAQVSGLVGRNLPFVLPKLMAIDPAGPLFNILSPSITASDAACVICVHTDQGFFGTTHACNHIDFYPNGGDREQPGCLSLSLEYTAGSCSHVRGEGFMTEAAMYPNAFIGVKCNSWNDFKAGKCDNNVTVPMGFNTPCSASGKFYLQTNSKSRFAKGQSGIVYQS